MSRLRTCLVGMALFAAGVASSSAISVLILRAGQPTGDGSAAALPDLAMSLAGAAHGGHDPLLQAAARHAASSTDSADAGGALIVPPALTSGLALATAALTAVDAGNASFAAPIFDLSDHGATRAGSADEVRLSVAMGSAGTAGGSVAAAREEIASIATGNGGDALAGMLSPNTSLGSGGGSAGGGVGAIERAASLPSPVPVPAAALFGGAALAALGSLRAYRRS